MTTTIQDVTGSAAVARLDLAGAGAVIATVDGFEPGRLVWSVADAVVMHSAGRRPASEEQAGSGVEVMVSRTPLGATEPVHPGSLIPLPMPGESICLTVDGAPRSGVVLEVSTGPAGQVQLVWETGSRIRR